MTPPNSRTTVAVIGAGHMGSAIVEALLAGGHKVAVWNRTIEKCAPLASAGARIVESPAEAIASTDLVVLCVLDYDASMAIMATAGVDSALDGGAVIQLTTLSPSDSVSLDAWFRQRGAAYLDGAIIGYPPDIRNGTAKLLLSGARGVFEDNRDILKVLCSKATFMDERPGSALVADKLIYALFYGIAFAWLQTAAMAATAGITIADFRDLMSGDERWQWRGQVMAKFLDMVERRDYSDAGAHLEAHAAAFRHVVCISDDLNVGSEFSRLIAETIDQAIERGYGKDELAAIFEVMIADRFQSTP